MHLSLVLDTLNLKGKLSKRWFHFKRISIVSRYATVIQMKVMKIGVVLNILNLEILNKYFAIGDNQDFLHPIIEMKV